MAPKDEDIPMSGLRSFVQILGNLRRGRTESELSEALSKLVGTVQETGKAGQLVLTIDVRRMKGAAAHVLQIADTIKVKMPERDRDASMFFADEENKLHRQDPRQYDLIPEDADKTNVKELAQNA